MKKILIVAPHPDDEVLGCGGIMAKYSSKGCEVFVAVMTNASLGAPELFSSDVVKMIREEAKEAHKVLGVKETFFYDFPAPRLETSPSYLISIELNKLIVKLNIDTLYLPHRGDMHKDHGVIFFAALVAARPINNCPVKKIYTYETLSETEWAAPFGNDVFIPNVFEDVTEFLDLKFEAMKCFKSQLKEYPHSRSLKALEGLSIVRGVTVGVEKAEAFALIRDIR